MDVSYEAQRSWPRTTHGKVCCPECGATGYIGGGWVDKHAEHVTCVCGQVVSKRGLNSHITMKARFGHPCSADTPPPEDDLLYDAWCVIANAPGWEDDTEWRRAAIRWRDKWHETLPSDDWPEEATRNTEEHYGFEPGQKVGDMAAACKPCGGSGRTHQPYVGWNPCSVCHGSGLANGV